MITTGAALAEPPPWAKGAAEKPCLGKEDVIPGQGLSCRVEGGLWKVKLRNGNTLLTHGPDAATASSGGAPAPSQASPSRTLASGGTALAATARQPKCPSANPNGNYYSVAIVAWPSNVTPNETDSSFRSRIMNANGLLYEDAIASGSPNGADYIFACDAVGQIRVDRVQLPTPAGSATFSTIVSDLQAKGYNKTNEKYVVWYDDRTIPYCGEGSFYGDERDSGSNYNNVGPDYGISYDCDAIMHEHGHNIGAVQYNAPYSTGSGGHCWQEYDVMCYPDGGNRYPGSLTYSCTDRNHFDCNFNDYFDAKIGAGAGSVAGSYLDTKWNIGECYNRWILNYVCVATSPPPPPPTTTTTTTSSYSSTVLSHSPVGYWRLGETSGTTASDASGQGNAGSYVNGVTLGAAGALSGDSNTAASFDGSDDHVRVPSSTTLNPTSAVTLEAWVKPTSGGFTYQKPIMLKSYSSHSAPYYQYGLFLLDRADYPKYITFALSLAGNLTFVQVPNAGWQYGVWNHIAATYDGAAMRIYLNGTQVGSKAAAGQIGSYATPLVVGAYENLAKYSYYVFQGQVDEPAVYGRALSATELQSHYGAR